MKGKNRYQLRHAAGVYWLLDMEQTGGEYRKPVAMNECGACIWQNYAESMSEYEIACMLHEQYGISVEEAYADVKLFLRQLEEQGISCEKRVK